MNLISTVGPSTEQLIFELIEYIKTQKDNEIVLTLELNDLDPTGVEISKWEINIKEILLVDFGSCDYSTGEINMIKIIMKIHSVKIEY